MNGSAIALPWISENVPAIVEGWYGGQAGGKAIAEVLFGDYNPAGRLPVTFYQSTDDLPPFEDYNMENRTYRYFEGEALYPFGHGLSYTTFEYGAITLNENSFTNDGKIKLSVEVTNSGELAGDEVVQLYVSYPESEVSRPIRDLRGFDRVHLNPGESKKVEFLVDLNDLRYWDAENDTWVLESTTVEFQVGASSSDIRQTNQIEIF